MNREEAVEALQLIFFQSHREPGLCAFLWGGIILFNLLFIFGLPLRWARCWRLAAGSPQARLV